jgi:tetratricopeptide (TPR) repeat protein
MAQVTLTLPEAMKRAIGAYERGQLADADRLVHAILGVKADYFDALHLLGVINARQRRFEEALTKYDRALAQRSDDAELLNNRGNTLQVLKRYEDALASYERALVVRPDYPETLSNRGVTLYELKRFEEAVASYDRALALRPDYAKAFYNRGLALHELERFDEALVSYERALDLRPDYAEALSNRAITLHALRRFEESLTSCDRALAISPDYAEALYNRGATLDELTRFDEALESYDRALALRPDYAEVLNNRGIALHKLQRFDEALANYERVLAVQPENAGAFHNRAVTLQALRRFDEALASEDRSLALRPESPEGLSNRGTTLHELKRFDEALASYDGALALRPDHAEALNNRGNTMHELKRFEEALASLDRALALRPNYPEALYNRGVTLHALGRFDDALTSYDQALAVRPDHAETLGNRGNTLLELQLFDEALTSYQRSLAVRPDYPDAHWNMSLVQLLAGDFFNGWREYEWRWKIEGLGLFKRGFVQPLWLGESEIAGKTILLHSEQGYGDTIQFCRYAPLVAARGARVLLEVPASLRALMTSVAGVAEVIAPGDTLPHFDAHCPLLSLPLAFRTELETIPALAPYLSPPADAAQLRNITKGSKRRLRVGLSWSGSPTHKNDANRSISLRSLWQLLELNADFVSLQKDVRPEDAKLLKDRSNLVHFGEKLDTFSDTAAVISNLDLVISVDTSIAHLAGALAKPVWILLPKVPDWRWLLAREDSPWYPTARLFRQDTQGEWSSVIRRVHFELDKLASGHLHQRCVPEQA